MLIFLVTSYEIKYSIDAADLINSNFDDGKNRKKRSRIITEDDVEVGSLQPEMAGALQMVVVVLTNIQRDTPYYVALRAIDKANKKSRVSNMAAFFVPESKLPNLKSMNQESDEEVIEIVDDLDELGVYGIVLIVSTTIALMIIVCVGAYFLAHYLQKIHRQKNEVYTVVPLA